ncbi:NADH dehydrogenase subunit 5 [Mammaliicoccus sciuri]|uniref:NADH dehydrogenase subunit 5 n=1 Tax=Mammaliicoccus sciuri TaxID=1296 RepID=UPI0021D1A4FC|nr:NADH dehydrogenase subunit 5 [Mammaliicoccus sciuri]UXV29700.1 NADH dehydrogenase subunit 5 [Mammaliicoccus sciuri]
MTGLLVLFFISIGLALISSIIYLVPKVAKAYNNVHLVIAFIPVLISLFGLCMTSGNVYIGFWHLDKLSWLLALFILSIGLIIQRFSVRYLDGDAQYRKYFSLFTFMTVFASVGWLSNDLRLMAILWGVTLFCLTRLIGLNKQWHITKRLAKSTSMIFIVSWIALVIAIILTYNVTGEWQQSAIFSEIHLDQFDSWQGVVIQLMLVISVIIPAAQWPFHRWLIESVAAPTPVSAIMHAGIVNVGGVILTRFAPIFTNEWIIGLLIIIATISVLMGAGISLVHVDYKRQLVGSTIGQMGFMLIQCALGVYSAAIVHLMLHGLFKATLFLRSGSAVRTFDMPSRMNESVSYIWVLVGRLLSIMIGIIFWIMDPTSSYQIISALILAWSLSVSWTQLVAYGEGKLGRIIGLLALLIVGLSYFGVHHLFHDLLHQYATNVNHTPLFAVIIMIVLLLIGSALNLWVARNHSSKIVTIIYLWIVHLGESKVQNIETHPRYLKNHTFKGGYQHDANN